MSPQKLVNEGDQRKNKCWRAWNRDEGCWLHVKPTRGRPRTKQDDEVVGDKDVPTGLLRIKKKKSNTFKSSYMYNLNSYMFWWWACVYIEYWSLLDTVCIAGRILKRKEIIQLIVNVKTLPVQQGKLFPLNISMFLSTLLHDTFKEKESDIFRKVNVKCKNVSKFTKIMLWKNWLLQNNQSALVTIIVT